MAFIPLPDGIKIEIKMRKSGAPVVNIVWGNIFVEVNTANLEAIATAVRNWWIANIKPNVSSTTALESVTVTDWSVANSLQVVDTLAIPSAGTASGDDTPSNVAAVTTFYTGFTGRSNRGRVYNGGLVGGQITGNTLNTLYVAAMLAAWVDFKADLLAAGANHIVASFYSNGLPRAEGVMNVVTDYGMNNVVDTQRRRIPRVDN